MADIFRIHPSHPQGRLLRQAAEVLRSGGLLALPTDSAYALCGRLGDADVLARIRRIRGVDEHHHFTLLCRDLSEISSYARVDNRQYRLLKAATPGPYTFILEGSRELPRRMLHPKRRTVGIRVPEHVVLQALLTELDDPLVSSTLIMAGESEPLGTADDIQQRLKAQLDLILDAGPCPPDVTTVVDLTTEPPRLLRQGRGSLARLGLDASTVE